MTEPTLHNVVTQVVESGIRGRIDLMYFLHRLSKLDFAPQCVRELQWLTHFSDGRKRPYPECHAVADAWVEATRLKL